MQEEEINKILADQESYFNKQIDAFRRVTTAVIHNGLASNGWCAEQAGLKLEAWRKLLKETADIG